MKAILTHGSVPKTLFRLSVPMAWGIFAIVAFSFTDTYFVGKLGTEELAALGFTFPVVMSVLGISFGIGTAGSSLISRAIGKEDFEQVKVITFSTLFLAFIVVFLCALLGFVTIDVLFRALGASETVLPLVRSYMQIWYVGVVFLIIPIVGNHCIRASGDTKTPSLIMTIAAVLNVVLDPILIFGWFGVPRLEIEGAAFATLIARVFTLIAALYILTKKKQMLEFKWVERSQIFEIWKALARIAAPAGASFLIAPLTSGLVTALIAKFGTEAVAAFGVVTRVEQVALIFLMGASASLGPFVGQNFGAGKVLRLRKGLNLVFGFSLFWGVLVAVILAVFAEAIIELFDTDPEVIRIGSLYLLILPSVYVFEGIQLAAASTFNALGRPFAPTLVIALRMFLIYIPLAYILRDLWGVTGIFLANFLGMLIGGVAMFVLVRRLCWKILK